MMIDPVEAKPGPKAHMRERKAWALVHDGVAHPLMALSNYAPWSVRFHNFTSRRAWIMRRRDLGPLL